jgi:hypothetical protein
MINIAGIFTDRAGAERAIRDMRILGIPESQFALLSPGDSGVELQAVQTADTEQPGMGKALGGVIGGAAGIASGMIIGAAFGPALVLGALGAALFGVAGEGLDRALLDGLPKDELFLYEDALRQGRSVVMCLARDNVERDEVRRIFQRERAESIDAARRRWWIGLRDVENEHYAAGGGDFETDEDRYRRGFEAALHPDFRGRAWDDVLYNLVERYPEWDSDSFRKGFERGRRYLSGKSGAGLA